MNAKVLVQNLSYGRKLLKRGETAEFTAAEYKQLASRGLVKSVEDKPIEDADFEVVSEGLPPLEPPKRK